MSGTFLASLAAVVCAAALASPPSIRLRYELEEESPPHRLGTSISRDADLVQYYHPNTLRNFSFSVYSGALDFVFIRNGALHTNRSVDREAICPRGRDPCTLEFLVAAFPVASYPYQPISVSLEITDVNDNSPHFAEKSVTVVIPEEGSVDASFQLPTATDVDVGSNAVLRYVIANSDTFGLQHSSPDQLSLNVLRPLDRETRDRYTLTVTALDGGSPERSDTLSVQVQVSDSNDHAPHFVMDSYDVTVSESAKNGTRLLKLEAEDRDSGANALLTYALESVDRHFHVDAQSGELFLTRPLDRETTKIILLIVSVRDGAAVPKSSRATVHVSVGDVNDNAPEIVVTSLKSQSRFAVAENRKVREHLAHIKAVDPDDGDNGNATCRLADAHPTEVALLDAFDGGYDLMATRPFDAELQRQVSVDIVCRDHGVVQARVTSRTVFIDIDDVNDNAPKFRVSELRFHLREDESLHHRIIAVDKDREAINRNSSFSVDAAADPWFSITSNGTLHNRIKLDYESAQTIRFVVTASDGLFSNSVTVVVKLENVDDEIPEFDQQSLTLEVMENAAVTTLVGVVSVHDPDLPPYDQVVLAFVPVSRDLTIDRRSGQVRTLRAFDREVEPFVRVTVRAVSVTNASLYSEASLTGNVIDRNDNAPVFVFPRFNNDTIYANRRSDVRIADLRATDNDFGSNARLAYRIVTSNVSTHFVVVPNGTLYARNVLFLPANVSIEVEARDHGDPQLVTTATLRVLLGDQTSSGLTGSDVMLAVIVTSAVLVSVLLVVIIFMMRCSARRSTVAGAAAEHATLTSPKTAGTAERDKYDIVASAERSGAPSNIYDESLRAERDLFQQQRPGRSELDGSSDVSNGSVEASLTDSGRGASDDGVPGGGERVATRHLATGTARRAEPATATVAPRIPPRAAAHSVLPAKHENDHFRRSFTRSAPQPPVMPPAASSLDRHSDVICQGQTRRDVTANQMLPWPVLPECSSFAQPRDEFSDRASCTTTTSGSFEPDRDCDVIDGYVTSTDTMRDYTSQIRSRAEALRVSFI